MVNVAVVFLEVSNSIFKKVILLDNLNTETISHIITFIKILIRNGRFANLKNTYEFPANILALTSHQSLKIN